MLLENCTANTLKDRKWIWKYECNE